MYLERRVLNMCQNIFGRNINMRSKFSCVCSSHSLCERAHTHSLEGTLHTIIHTYIIYAWIIHTNVHMYCMYVYVYSWLGMVSQLRRVWRQWATLLHSSIAFRPHCLTSLGWERSWVDYLEGALYKTAVIIITHIRTNVVHTYIHNTYIHTYAHTYIHFGA